MASRVTSKRSAGEAVWEHLDRCYPELAACDLSVIALGEGWLAQVEGQPKARLLFMVNRYGFVEKIGRARATANAATAGSSLVSRHPIDVGQARIDLTQPVRLY